MNKKPIKIMNWQNKKPNWKLWSTIMYNVLETSIWIASKDQIKLIDVRKSFKISIQQFHNSKQRFNKPKAYYKTCILNSTEWHKQSEINKYCKKSMLLKWSWSRNITNSLNRKLSILKMRMIGSMLQWISLLRNNQS